MFHFPTPMLMSGGKTYEAFVALISGAVERPWTASDTFVANRTYRTTGAVNEAGGMVGSIWGGRYTDTGARTNKILRHGLPDEATYLAQRDGLLQSSFRIISAGPRVTFHSYERNGYTSVLFADGNPYPAFFCDQIRYWDPALEMAMVINPNAATAPEPLEW